MLSFGKIVVLLLVGVVLVLGFGIVGKMKRQRDQIERLKKEAHKVQEQKPPPKGTAEMQRCKVCEAYVTQRCARRDCPIKA